MKLTQYHFERERILTKNTYVNYVKVKQPKRDCIAKQKSPETKSAINPSTIILMVRYNGRNLSKIIQFLSVT